MKKNQTESEIRASLEYLAGGKNINPKDMEFLVGFLMGKKPGMSVSEDSSKPWDKKYWNLVSDFQNDCKLMGLTLAEFEDCLILARILFTQPPLGSECKHSKGLDASGPVVKKTP